MTHKTMNLEQLFAALRKAVIAEFESEGDAQHSAVEAEGVIVREIRSREGTERYYRAMLDDEHPSVRYRGALGIKKIDPSGAMKVFQVLADSNQSNVSVIALHEVMALEKQGIV